MPGKKSLFAIILIVLAAAIVAFSAWDRKDPAQRVDPGSEEVMNAVEGRRLDQAFYDILREHPRPEISKDLYASILDRSMRYSFDLNTGANAAFTVVMGSEALPPQDPSVTIPVIYVKERLVVAATLDADARRWLQTVIYHEYQHYLQWRAADDAGKEIFRGSRADRRLTSEDCKALYRNELDAYLAECALTQEMGWKTENEGLCVANGDLARFKRLLRDWMISYMPDMKLDHCIPALQEI